MDKEMIGGVTIICFIMKQTQGACFQVLLLTFNPPIRSNRIQPTLGLIFHGLSWIDSKSLSKLQITPLKFRINWILYSKISKT